MTIPAPQIPAWRNTLATSLAALPAGGLAILQPAQGPRAARRLARALLEEAAVLGGGQVLGLPGGDLLLTAAPGPAQRAARAIADLTGLPPDSFPLPEAEQPLLARAEAAALATPTPAWTLAALEAHVARMPLEGAARLTLFASGTGSHPVAQRLGPAPLGLDDPELEALAREALCRRLLAALTDPGMRGQLPPLRPGLRLILDLPQGGLPGGALRAGPPGDPDGPLALLPLAALATPAAFAQSTAALRAAGWAIGLLANDAAAPAELELPEITWVIPAAAAPPRHPPARLIALGRPVPAWCRAPGILHEGVA
ncbi:hypothetical protein KTR66_19755 [Roseococcus sp. SDR]|uniref:hypothetical protein n=1 Tax=Roseococcus sp. SDR TaxID=2835532 RepID=UPI001BCC8557|nr:hypothetical protein [Roseococcus sp. SDR]MBS7792244.1 hypothetical protein [Roseococcus sp. SDR]MBV1847558.1 hypothetical protein [Roseococcus sp. SDR]